MRQGLSAQPGSRGANSPRGIAPPAFPRPVIIAGRSAWLAPRSAIVQGPHYVTGSPETYSTRGNNSAQQGRLRRSRQGRKAVARSA
jgi:hypothetical protein